MKPLDALLTGLVDYAGLFPPAGQSMQTAMESYGAYLASAEHSVLGRFILPFSRIGEFEALAKNYLARGPESEPWRLSVIVAKDIREAGEEMLRFNCHHWSGSDDGHAVIEVAELKAGTAEEIRRQCGDLPRAFTPYVEIPLGDKTGALIEAIALAGARAKIRTGGVTADAFPAATSILDFLVACKRSNVRFKATAGLHHPLRGEYRLTYEPGSTEALMYGYLNVFLAAALVYRGEAGSRVLDLLNERDHSAFSFSDVGVEWRGVQISAEDLHAVRENFANSFGSCSFREPVDEIRELTTIGQS